jgi:hypothetical protein
MDGYAIGGDEIGYDWHDCLQYCYSSLAGRQELPRRRVPHLMDCNDSYLVLFTKDSCLYLYSISATGSAEKYANTVSNARYLITLLEFQCTFSCFTKYH